eukprot:scaffold1057_cov459-Prasinococcus_capsulatus_cf.AAC.7
MASRVIATFDVDICAPQFCALFSVGLLGLGCKTGSGLTVQLSDLHIQGTMQIIFYISKQTPGVQGVDYAFLSQPKVSLKVSTLGVTLSSLPLVTHWFDRLVTEHIRTNLVKPNFDYYSVSLWYQRQMMSIHGGSCGLLSILILDLQDFEEESLAKIEKTYPPSLQLQLDLSHRHRLQSNLIALQGNRRWDQWLYFPLGEDDVGLFQDETELLHVCLLGHETHAPSLSGLVLGKASISLKRIAASMGLRHMYIPLAGPCGATLSIRCAFLERHAPDETKCITSVGGSNSAYHEAHEKSFEAPVNSTGALDGLVSALQTRSEAAETRFEKVKMECELLQHKLASTKLESTSLQGRAEGAESKVRELSTALQESYDREDLVQNRVNTRFGASERRGKRAVPLQANSTTGDDRLCNDKDLTSDQALGVSIEDMQSPGQDLTVPTGERQVPHLRKDISGASGEHANLLVQIARMEGKIRRERAGASLAIRETRNQLALAKAEEASLRRDLRVECFKAGKAFPNK